MNYHMNSLKIEIFNVILTVDFNLSPVHLWSKSAMFTKLHQSSGLTTPLSYSPTARNCTTLNPCPYLTLISVKYTSEDLLFCLGISE